MELVHSMRFLLFVVPLTFVVVGCFERGSPVKFSRTGSIHFDVSILRVLVFMFCYYVVREILVAITRFAHFFFGPIGAEEHMFCKILSFLLRIYGYNAFYGNEGRGILPSAKVTFNPTFVRTQNNGETIEGFCAICACYGHSTMNHLRGARAGRAARILMIESRLVKYDHVSIGRRNHRCSNIFAKIMLLVAFASLICNSFALELPKHNISAFVRDKVFFDSETLLNTDRGTRRISEFYGVIDCSELRYLSYVPAGDYTFGDLALLDYFEDSNRPFGIDECIGNVLVTADRTRKFSCITVLRYDTDAEEPIPFTKAVTSLPYKGGILRCSKMAKTVTYGKFSRKPRTLVARPVYDPLVEEVKKHCVADTLYYVHHEGEPGLQGFVDEHVYKNEVLASISNLTAICFRPLQNLNDSYLVYSYAGCDYYIHEDDDMFYHAFIVTISDVAPTIVDTLVAVRRGLKAVHDDPVGTLTETASDAATAAVDAVKVTGAKVSDAARVVIDKASVAAVSVANTTKHAAAAVANKTVKVASNVKDVVVDVVGNVYDYTGLNFTVSFVLERTLSYSWLMNYFVSPLDAEDVDVAGDYFPDKSICERYECHELLRLRQACLDGLRVEVVTARTVSSQPLRRVHRINAADPKLYSVRNAIIAYKVLGERNFVEINHFPCYTPGTWTLFITRTGFSPVSWMRSKSAGFDSDTQFMKYVTGVSYLDELIGMNLLELVVVFICVYFLYQTRVRHALRYTVLPCGRFLILVISLVHQYGYLGDLFSYVVGVSIGKFMFVLHLFCVISIGFDILELTYFVQTRGSVISLLQLIEIAVYVLGIFGFYATFFIVALLVAVNRYFEGPIEDAVYIDRKMAISFLENFRDSKNLADVMSNTIRQIESSGGDKRSRFAVDCYLKLNSGQTNWINTISPECATPQNSVVRVLDDSVAPYIHRVTYLSSMLHGFSLGIGSEYYVHFPAHAVPTDVIDLTQLNITNNKRHDYKLTSKKSLLLVESNNGYTGPLHPSPRTYSGPAFMVFPSVDDSSKKPSTKYVLRRKGFYDRGAHNISTVGGDCGLPIFTDEPTPRLLGFHEAGTHVNLRGTIWENCDSVVNYAVTYDGVSSPDIRGYDDPIAPVRHTKRTVPFYIPQELFANLKATYGEGKGYTQEFLTYFGIKKSEFRAMHNFDITKLKGSLPFRLVSPKINPESNTSEQSPTTEDCADDYELSAACDRELFIYSYLPSFSDLKFEQFVAYSYWAYTIKYVIAALILFSFVVTGSLDPSMYLIDFLCFVTFLEKIFLMEIKSALLRVAVITAVYTLSTVFYSYSFDFYAFGHLLPLPCAIFVPYFNYAKVYAGGDMCVPFTIGTYFIVSFRIVSIILGFVYRRNATIVNNARAMFEIYRMARSATINAEAQSPIMLKGKRIVHPLLVDRVIAGKTDGIPQKLLDVINIAISTERVKPSVESEAINLRPGTYFDGVRSSAKVNVSTSPSAIKILPESVLSDYDPSFVRTTHGYVRNEAAAREYYEKKTAELERIVCENGNAALMRSVLSESHLDTPSEPALVAAEKSEAKPAEPVVAEAVTTVDPKFCKHDYRFSEVTQPDKDKSHRYSTFKCTTCCDVVYSNICVESASNVFKLYARVLNALRRDIDCGDADEAANALDALLKDESFGSDGRSVILQLIEMAKRYTSIATINELYIAMRPHMKCDWYREVLSKALTRDINCAKEIAQTAVGDDYSITSESADKQAAVGAAASLAASIIGYCTDGKPLDQNLLSFYQDLLETVAKDADAIRLINSDELISALSHLADRAFSELTGADKNDFSSGAMKLRRVIVKTANQFENELRTSLQRAEKLARSRANYQKQQDDAELRRARKVEHISNLVTKFFEKLAQEEFDHGIKLESYVPEVFSCAIASAFDYVSDAYSKFWSYVRSLVSRDEILETTVQAENSYLSRVPMPCGTNIVCDESHVHRGFACLKAISKAFDVHVKECSGCVKYLISGRHSSSCASGRPLTSFVLYTRALLDCGKCTVCQFCNIACNRGCDHYAGAVKAETFTIPLSTNAVTKWVHEDGVSRLVYTDGGSSKVVAVVDRSASMNGYKTYTDVKRLGGRNLHVNLAANSANWITIIWSKMNELVERYTVRMESFLDFALVTDYVEHGRSIVGLFDKILKFGLDNSLDAVLSRLTKEELEAVRSKVQLVLDKFDSLVAESNF